MAEEKVVNTEAVAEAPKQEASEKKPFRGPRGNKGGKFSKREGGKKEFEKQYEEKVIAINRVSKTVKGGRHMRFAALVAVGDGKGNFGFGCGKAGEVPDAIKKALDAAKKNTSASKIVKGDTIPHEVIGKFGACQVFLKPAPEGTGIIAGGPVRAILELAGIRNVYSKVYGSRAPINIIRATHNGLNNLKSYSQVQALRAKVEEPVETKEEE